MFTKKVPEREKCDSEQIIYHDNFHSRVRVEADWNQDHFYNISIDPGVVHLGIKIGRRWKDPSVKYKCNRFEILHIKKYKLAPHKGEKIDIILHKMDLILNFLFDEYKLIFLHKVIVERQLNFNYKPTRIMQHVISYFKVRLRNAPYLPVIIEMDAKLKGAMLGAPKGLSERDLKRWSVAEGKRLAHALGMFHVLALIEHEENQGTEANTKGDELTDAMLQEEALYIVWGWDKSHIPIPIKDLHCDKCDCDKCRMARRDIKFIRQVANNDLRIPLPPTFDISDKPNIPQVFDLFNKANIPQVFDLF